MGPTKTASSSATDPPVAILWAYQLRREHSHLISRFDALECTNVELVATNESLKISIKTLTSKVMNLEKTTSDVKAAAVELVAKLRNIEDENKRIQADLIKVRKERDKGRETARSVDRHLDKLDREEGELRVAFEEFKKVAQTQLQRLEESKTLKANNADSSSGVAFLEQRNAPDLVQESVEEIPVPHHHEPTLRQSEISTSASTPSPQPKLPLSRPGQHLPSFFPKLQGSAFDAESSIFHPEPPITDRDILNGIRQGSLDLDSYIRETAAKVPRFGPRGAATVIEAFLDGLDDAGTRKKIATVLDSNGWTWDVILQVPEMERKQAEGDGSHDQSMQEHTKAHFVRQDKPKRYEEPLKQHQQYEKVRGQMGLRSMSAQTTRQERIKTFENDAALQGQHEETAERDDARKRKMGVRGDVPKGLRPQPRKRPKRVGGHWLQTRLGEDGVDSE